MKKSKKAEKPYKPMVLFVETGQVFRTQSACLTGRLKSYKGLHFTYINL